jgi:hypothetical protein
MKIAFGNRLNETPTTRATYKPTIQAKIAGRTYHLWRPPDEDRRGICHFKELVGPYPRANPRRDWESPYSQRRQLRHKIGRGDDRSFPDKAWRSGAWAVRRAWKAYPPNAGKRSLVGGRIARRFFLARNSFLDFLDRRFNALMTPIRANIVGRPNVATRIRLSKGHALGTAKVEVGRTKT